MESEHRGSSSIIVFAVSWDEENRRYTHSPIVIETGLTFTTVADGSPAVGNLRQVAVSQKT